MILENQLDHERPHKILMHLVNSKIPPPPNQLITVFLVSPHILHCSCIALPTALHGQDHSHLSLTHLFHAQLIFPG